MSELHPDRDHGGDLDRAIATFGGQAADWLDLSTGINRNAYSVPQLAQADWQDLPTRTAMAALVAAAQKAYRTKLACLPVAGAQAAIQLVPRLMSPGRAGIVTPTYNEHAAALTTAGWHVTQVARADDLAGFDVATIVNPNNPDGRSWSQADIHALAARNTLLVVDESFMDPTPDLSLTSGPLADNILVLRSFGKFFGLAGLRLGFVLGAADRINALRAIAGPWAVSGPAIAVGTAALADTAWQEATRATLTADAARLDAWAARRHWGLLGGTSLFRTYETANAGDAQTALARHKIWSRIFPYSQTWMRLGVPYGSSEWARLDTVSDQDRG